MVRQFGLIAVMFVLGSSPARAHDENTVPLITNGQGSGCGVAIGMRGGLAYVLTAAHVADIGRMVNGQPAQVIAVDRRADLALLCCRPWPGMRFIPVATRENPNAPCVIYAQWPGLFGTFSSQGYATTGDDTLIALATGPGSSGGPLVDATTNRVVGIVSRGNGLMTVFGSSQAIRRLLTQSGHGWLID